MTTNSDDGQGENLPVVYDPASVDPDHLWRAIPDIIRDFGRSHGYQAARDLIFYHWNQLRSNMPGYSALKLAIEFDRHAMFAEIASERAKGRYDTSLWAQYQMYLSGEVAESPAAGYVPKESISPSDGGAQTVSEEVEPPDVEESNGQDGQAELFGK